MPFNILHGFYRALPSAIKLIHFPAKPRDLSSSSPSGMTSASQPGPALAHEDQETQMDISLHHFRPSNEITITCDPGRNRSIMQLISCCFCLYLLYFIRCWNIVRKSICWRKRETVNNQRRQFVVCGQTSSVYCTQTWDPSLSLCHFPCKSLRQGCTVFV